MGTTCMATAPAPTTKPATAAQPSLRGRPAVVCASVAAASSALLWACFHPVAWGFLGWVALVPFLVLVRAQCRPRVLYGCAFLCGLAFFVPVLQWMSVADKAMIGAWLALSVYCALYFPAALFCVRGLERWRVPIILSLPVVWTVLEYLRSFLLTGFPWYYLAHTQHNNLAMIQITDLGGVYIVSFVIAAVNAFVFDVAYQFPEIRRWFHQSDLEPYRTYSTLDLFNRSVFSEWSFRRNLLIEGTLLAGLLIGVYAYGRIRLGENQFLEGPTVALLQSNIDQRLREAAAAEQRGERSGEIIEQKFVRLWARATMNQSKPDLVIWPETSFPFPWVTVSSEIPPARVPTAFLEWEDDMRKKLGAIVHVSQVPHLVGINSGFRNADERDLRFNSALLLNRRLVEGRVQVDAKYDKVHRVPFGEFVPLKDWLPFLSWLTPYEGDFGIQKGDKLVRFEVGQHRFGVLLCYEDTDPALARQYVEKTADGPPVDFLVNMSNDGWFDGSSEHEEHLAVCRFRAIECRRSMVRAVNMGISAVIDGNGRVLKPRLMNADVLDREPAVWMPATDMKDFVELSPFEWSQFKKVEGVLKAAVPIDRRESVYARVGDWLPIGGCAALLSCAVWALWRRRFPMPVAA